MTRPITCGKCGHPLVIGTFGALQKCPNCSVVDAINKQTQAPQPQTSSNNSLGLMGWIFVGAFFYGLYLGAAAILQVMWEYKWWSLTGIIIISLLVAGMLSDD